MSDISEYYGYSEHFINILRSLLLIPSDPIYGNKMWSIVSSHINQIFSLSYKEMECSVVNIEDIKVIIIYFSVYMILN